MISAAGNNTNGDKAAGWFRLTNDLIDSGAWASLVPAAAKVLVVLARHADKNGVCFPGRRKIAEEAGISPETVTGATRALVKAGLVTREARKSKDGDPDSNEYRVLTLPPKSGDGAGTDTPRRSNREGIGCSAERVPVVAPDKEDTSEEDPSEAHSCKRARKSGSVYSVDFDEWWNAYPKKEGKRAAWKAYQDALHRIAEQDSGDVVAAQAKLLDRAKAFAVTPKGQAGRFCPNPSTWLNQDRYDDDPAAWQHGGETNGKPRQASAGSTYDETANYSSLGER